MVVNLGCSLGMRVVAEGIETEEQRQHLLALGCHEGQGWLFAKPMPAEELDRWLAAPKSWELAPAPAAATAAAAQPVAGAPCVAPCATASPINGG